MKIAIQGARGSFNEQALLENERRYLPAGESLELVYALVTAEVLRLVRSGEVELGHFALKNSIGGYVQETLDVIGPGSGYEEEFEELGSHTLHISHHLMAHPEATLKDITHVYTHPQVILQCQSTLHEKYPNLIVEEWEVSPAPSRVAIGILNGELEKHVATLSCRDLSDKVGLKILDSHLEDHDDNYTTFVVIKKR